MSAVRAPEAGAGRLVRGGRVVARVLLVWVVSVVALRLLAAVLPGFVMPQVWQPTVVALAFGVLSAVGWPLVLRAGGRIALPFAVLTLGAGTFLLLGAALLGLSFLIPGVVIADLGTAVVVTVVMSGVAALVSSVLGLDEDEIFFRRAARRTPGGGPDDRPPGVLFLQVDGLGFETVRRAVRDGDMPTLARWLAEGSHALTDWHCDWSSQTGASVCAILHGSNDDVLGFRWYEKDRDHVMACAHPDDAAEIERRHADGAGLLALDGAAHGNLFTGDAEHVSLTMSAVPLLAGTRRRGRRGPFTAGYYAYFANPYNAVRTVGSAAADIAREVSASVRQRRAGVRPRVDRGGFYPFARAGTNVVVRDVVVSAVIGDMLEGRSVVYADFLGYDEVAHHSGVERFDALAVLREIDRQIGRLDRATQLAPRRYVIVALSDHGQTQGEAFAHRFGESVEQLVGRLCGGDGRGGGDGRAARLPAEGWQVGAALAERGPGDGPVARRLRARVASDGEAGSRRGPAGEPARVPRVAPGVVAVASGHLAMVSFVDHPGRVPLETIEREHPDLLPALVDHPGVGFVLVRSARRGPLVLGRDGLRVLAADAAGDVVEGADPLGPYGPHAADLVRRYDGFAHCADLVVNSRYEPTTDEASPFELHVGSHGGLGGPQSRGFLLHPARLPAPGGIVGAEALHRVLRGWLTHLGQPEPAAGNASGPAPQMAPGR